MPCSNIALDNKAVFPNKTNMLIFEPAYDKTYNKTCATSEDSESACASTQSDQSLYRLYVPSTASGLSKEG